MLTLFRDGFAKDLIVLIVVSVLVGSLLSTGVAYAIDSYFGDTLNGLIGEFGEYDAILHFREEAKEAGLEELERLIDNRFPGARFKPGLTIAGQVNVFLSLPEEYKTKEVFSNFASYFGDLPGSSGYTLMVEPSVVVRGVNTAVRGRLLEEIEEIEGVRFTFHNGTSIYAMLTSVNKAKPVSRAIENLLESYQVVEVRFPMGYRVAEPTAVAADVANMLQERYDLDLVQDITLAEESEEYQSFLKTLTEMKRFLLSYASRVDIDLSESDASLGVGSRLILVPVAADVPASGSEIPDDGVIVEVQEVRGGQALGLIVQGSISYENLESDFVAYKLQSGKQIGVRVGGATVTNERYRLLQATEESIRLLHELDGLAAEANETVENAEGTLETFQAALNQLDELQQQIELLQHTMSERTNNNVFFTLLLRQMVNGLFAGEDGSGLGSLKDLDVAAMKENLAEIAARISAINTVRIDAIIQQIEKVKANLPDLTDEEIGQSIALIDRYIDGKVIPGEKIALLVDGDFDVKAAEEEIVAATGVDYSSVSTMPVGVVNPDPRAELFRVLREVRATIAGLLAVLTTLLLLILDHAAIMSTMKNLWRDRRGSEWWQRIAEPVRLFGAGAGALLLTGIYVLSQAKIPLLGLPHIILVGALLGILVSLFADRISPINVDEVMAGQALGLSYVQIMQEIVIPAGRPGLMTLLNRTKQRF